MLRIVHPAHVSILAVVAAICACAPAHVQAADPGKDMETFTAQMAFRDPQSPDVYRALSGMIDPQIGSATYFPDEVFSTRDPKLVLLLKHLFPHDPSSWNDFWVGGEDCRLDQPLATLGARVAALGDHSAYVQQWIRVQRTIFTACSYTQSRVAKVVVLPPKMSTSDPRISRWQREDRAYQAATALFYGQQMIRAVQAFDRIAASGSDQRYYARYMAIAIRAGTQPNRNDYKPLIPVARSLAEVRAFEADRSAPVNVRRYAYNLIGWIGASNQGEEARRAQVDATLQSLEAPLTTLKADGEAQRRYAAARDTREHLFSATPDAAALWTGDIPAEWTGTRAMIAAARRDRLAEWMVFPVSPWQPNASYRGGPAWAIAVTPKGAARVRSELARLAPDPADATNPWAHEALMWSDRYDPSLWPMIERETRAKAAHDERALHAADLDFYNQVRTAIMAGGADGFEATVAHLQAVPERRSLTWTTTVCEALRYLMAKGRIAEAHHLRDRLDLTSQARSDDASRTDSASYAGYGLRETGMLNVLILLAEDENHLVPLLSNTAYDQAPLLNRLPIPEMTRLASRTDVAMEWRSALARTAWTRTYALGRDVDPDLDRLMRRLNPDITARWLSRSGRRYTPTIGLFCRMCLRRRASIR